MSEHPWAQSRWRHKKRGTSYDVLTQNATAQCSHRPAIIEGDTVTVYRGDDGRWWVRASGEFNDGRFERIDLNEGWPIGGSPSAETLSEALDILRWCSVDHEDWRAAPLAARLDAFTLTAQRRSPPTLDPGFPIATAPRDEFIILWGPSGYVTTPWRCHVGRWGSDIRPHWLTHSGDHFTEDGPAPTRWSPLPFTRRGSSNV